MSTPERRWRAPGPALSSCSCIECLPGAARLAAAALGSDTGPGARTAAGLDDRERLPTAVVRVDGDRVATARRTGGHREARPGVVERRLDGRQSRLVTGRVHAVVVGR